MTHPWDRYIISLPFYHKKTTIQVGKYTVRPMDPSWELYITMVVNPHWALPTAKQVGSQRDKANHCPLIKANTFLLEQG